MWPRNLRLKPPRKSSPSRWTSAWWQRWRNAWWAPHSSASSRLSNRMRWKPSFPFSTCALPTCPMQSRRPSHSNCSCIGPPFAVPFWCFKKNSPIGSVRSRVIRLAWLHWVTLDLLPALRSIADWRSPCKRWRAATASWKWARTTSNRRQKSTPPWYALSRVDPRRQLTLRKCARFHT